MVRNKKTVESSHVSPSIRALAQVLTLMPNNWLSQIQWVNAQVLRKWLFSKLSLHIGSRFKRPKESSFKVIIAFTMRDKNTHGSQPFINQSRANASQV